MSIDKISGFSIFINEPIDSRFTHATTTLRDAIEEEFRYEGLIAYCLDTQTLYLLQGGITNDDWVAIGGGLGASTIDADRPISLIPNGTNLGATLTLASFLEACFFYAAPTINSFTASLTTALEIGEDTLTRTLNYNVSEPVNDYVIASIVITGSDGYNSGDIKSGTGDQSGTHDITLSANTNTTYTLTVTSTQAGVSVTSTISYTFRNKVYYGACAIATYDNAFIHALTGVLDSDYSRNFTADADGASIYIFYAVPKDYVDSPYLNPPYFYVGGFSGGFEIAAETVSYTYENNTEDYIIYKSVNPNLGETSVTVQST